MIPGFRVLSVPAKKAAARCDTQWSRAAAPVIGSKCASCKEHLKKTKKNKSTACGKEKKKKSCIVVWCVVNKVILQNSSGSSETSRRHLAELKANIDVVLGKRGSLHRLFSPPLCFGIFLFFFSQIHIICLMFRLLLLYYYFFFPFCVFKLQRAAAGPRRRRWTNCGRLNIFVRFSHRGFN